MSMYVQGSKRTGDFVDLVLGFQNLTQDFSQPRHLFTYWSSKLSHMLLRVDTAVSTWPTEQFRNRERRSNFYW
jgi:hypothetical protein